MGRGEAKKYFAHRQPNCLAGPDHDCHGIGLGSCERVECYESVPFAFCASFFSLLLLIFLIFFCKFVAIFPILMGRSLKRREERFFDWVFNCCFSSSIFSSFLLKICVSRALESFDAFNYFSRKLFLKLFLRCLQYISLRH